VEVLRRVLSKNVGLGNSSVNVFTTFFCSSSPSRQEELNRCLQNNLKNELIYSLNVFLDYNIDLSVLKKVLSNPEVEPFVTKLKFIFLDRIPSFKDWLSIPVNGISVFCNADIYFDDSLSLVQEYVRYNKSIVCLTRKEIISNSISFHPDPHWSQDCWALDGSNIPKIDFLEKLNISTGKMRCDNKIAYLFSMHGWDLYNPVNKVNCYHLHESKARNYDMGDTSILGALGFVRPCEDAEAPSKVEIHVMPLKTSNILVSSEMSGFLERLKK
jgi:hypothetical protein